MYWKFQVCWYKQDLLKMCMVTLEFVIRRWVTAICKRVSTFIWTVFDWGLALVHQDSVLQTKEVQANQVQNKPLACIQQLANTHRELEEYLQICVPKNTQGHKSVSSTDSWNTQVRAHKCKHVEKQAQCFLWSDVTSSYYLLICFVTFIFNSLTEHRVYTCTHPHRQKG